MASIGLIDPHPLFRQGFILLLEQLQHSVTIEVSNANDFIYQLNYSSVPELVLLDTRLQDPDSYTLLQWIKNHHPNLPAIALHHKNDFHFLLQTVKRRGIKSFIENSITRGGSTHLA
jgi:DNA-binding NarL/FixJ family response regulator